MVLYKCLTCLKEFNRKSNFITHIENKKKPCKPIIIEKHNILTENNKNVKILTKNNNNVKILNEFENKNNSDNLNSIINSSTCVYCYRKFANIYSLKRHLNQTCKVKKIDNEKKDEIFNKLIENDNKISKILNNYEDLQKENNKLKQHIKDLENKYNNNIKKIVNKNTNNTINNTNNNVNLIISTDKLVNFGKEDLSKISYEDIIKSCT